MKNQSDQRPGSATRRRFLKATSLGLAGLWLPRPAARATGPAAPAGEAAMARLGRSQAGESSAGGEPAMGPRGPVGPDVPWSEAEQRRWARWLTVEGRTAVAVQAACDRFVVEHNRFEDLRHGVGIRDGSGLIRRNLFRRQRAKPGRKVFAISVAYGQHNGIPVEHTMPHDIEIADNEFADFPEKASERYQVGQAENVIIDGKWVVATRIEGRPTPPRPPRLKPFESE